MRHTTILLTFGALTLATFATHQADAQDQPAEAAPEQGKAPTTAPAKAPKRPPGVWEEVPPEEQPEEEAGEKSSEGVEPREGDELFQQEQQQAGPPPASRPPPPGQYPNGPPPNGPPPGYYPPPPPHWGNVYAVPQKPPTERNNTGMMVGGIILAAVGGVALVVGGALANSGENGDYRCTGELCRNIPDEDKRNVGIGIALGGLAFIGAGIPLIVVGARRVPIATPADDGAPPVQAWLKPQLELGPSGGRLTWSF